MADTPPTAKLGDACIAAPFAAKTTKLQSVLAVVRQGRGALAVSSQMMLILAVNCLLNSYCLSVLYVDGVRLSDLQMTLQGLCIAACMFFVSRAPAAHELSEVRPRPSIVSLHAILTMLAQVLRGGEGCFLPSDM